MVGVALLNPQEVFMNFGRGLGMILPLVFVVGNAILHIFILTICNVSDSPKV